MQRELDGLRDEILTNLRTECEKIEQRTQAKFKKASRSQNEFAESVKSLAADIERACKKVKNEERESARELDSVRDTSDRTLAALTEALSAAQKKHDDQCKQVIERPLPIGGILKAITDCTEQIRNP